MKGVTAMRRQRGATLIVGIIMLVLITLMVTTAFQLSSSNQKTVGNMQFRNESIAAANAAIEEVISTVDTFTTPSATTITVNGYAVDVAEPVCLYATEVITDSSGDQTPNIFSESAGMGGGASSSFMRTYWDIAAAVNDNITGASVTAHHGVMVTLPVAQVDPSCL